LSKIIKKIWFVRININLLIVRGVVFLIKSAIIVRLRLIQKLKIGEPNTGHLFWLMIRGK